jgi:hypothetical protein
MTDTAPEPKPEPSPDGTLSDRVGKLEAGQESISTKVDRILGILDKPDSAEPVTSADAPPAPDIAEQMAEAIRKVNAETAEAEKSKPKPEVRPREAGQPGRQRLARALYGKEADR